MSIYKLYTATISEAAASLDITADGKIVGVAWAAVGDLDADGESFYAEVSFSSTNGLATNDTKSSFSTVRQFNGLLTSGAIPAAVNVYHGPLNIPVTMGERIYLHTSGTQIVCTVYIFVDDKAKATSRRVRL